MMRLLFHHNTIFSLYLAQTARTVSSVRYSPVRVRPRKLSIARNRARQRQTESAVPVHLIEIIKFKLHFI